MDDGMRAREIERVLRFERAMTRAYDIAMNKVQERDLIEVLAPFRERHDRSSEVLQQVADAQATAAPEVEESFRAYLEEVLGTIQDAVRRDEALGELRIAEAGLKVAYGRALEAVADDRDTARVLKDRLSDESEHVRVLAMAHAASKV